MGVIHAKHNFGTGIIEPTDDLSLANPFLLPEASGVRYYASTDLTGGHLSTMLSNVNCNGRRNIPNS